MYTPRNPDWSDVSHEQVWNRVVSQNRIAGEQTILLRFSPASERQCFASRSPWKRHTLFYRAVKCRKSKAVFIARLPVRSTSRLGQETKYLAQCVYAQGKRAWIRLSAPVMVTNTDQRKFPRCPWKPGTSATRLAHQSPWSPWRAD